MNSLLVYYLRKFFSVIGKRAIEYFESVAPGSQNNAINFDHDLDIALKNCGILEASNDASMWYMLSDVKNKVRISCHEENSRKRLDDLEVYVLVQQAGSTGSVPYEEISMRLRRMLSYSSKDDSLFRLFNHLSFWFLNQQNYDRCSRMTIDGTDITERPKLRDCFIQFLLSISNFVQRSGVNFVWELKAHFSNAYLNRLNRSLPFRYTVTDIRNDLHFQNIDLGTNFRGNIHGQREHLTIYITNRLQCPII